MRFLPNATPTSSANTLAIHSVTEAAAGPDKDVLTSSNSNSSSGVVMVDYTQYLKDSNISFDRGDMCKYKLKEMNITFVANFTNIRNFFKGQLFLSFTFSFSPLDDDEKDEEKLVIDDDNTDNEEQHQKPINTDTLTAQEQQQEQEVS